MSYSKVTYTGNGSQTLYTVTFPYLSVNHVSVYLNGVLTTAYTWNNSTTINFNTAPANGVVIVIQRSSNQNERLTNYQDGSTLTESILDADINQAFYLSQEAIDRANESISVNSTDVYDAQGKRLGNLTDPVDAQDVATKAYADALLVDGGLSEYPANQVTYTPDGTGAVATTVQAKLRESVSVSDRGAISGGSDGSTAFAAEKAIADAAGAPVVVPRGTYSIGTTQPDFDVAGDGVVQSNGVSTAGGNLRYNPARETVFYNPNSYQREVQGVNYPPSRGADYITSSYNTVFSSGSNLDDRTKTIRYNVVFGNQCGSAPGTWGYNDVFGGNAAVYAYNINRNTLIGSEVFAWGGAPNKDWLVTYQHDWWREPEDNPYIPGEVGWDANGLETKFPGMGARLDAFSAYATTEDDTAYNTAVGRDAGNHVVKGQRNTFMGYQAAGQMFVGSYNVAIGALAMRDAVFADYNTAVGDQAGRDCLDSTNAVFVGYGAGRTLQNASNSVIIGDRAADTKTSATGSVLIGQLVLSNESGSLDNKLAINNGNGAPLISGDFSADTAGINVSPNSLRAKWHVRNASSGSTLTPQVGMLLEGSGLIGLTLETTNTGFGQVKFADPENENIGFIEYSHSSDTMTFGANGSSRLRINNDGALRPWNDNTQTLGTASQRWSTVYAGTGTINTSDERTKQQIRELSEAERAVAIRLKGLIRAFKFNDAVSEKGSSARIHVGVIAQDVVAAFSAEGLQASDYGILCYDEWEAKPAEIETWDDEFDDAGILIRQAGSREVAPPVEAGNRYGVRYEELLAFVVAAL